MSKRNVVRMTAFSKVTGICQVLTKGNNEVSNVHGLITCTVTVLFTFFVIIVNENVKV